MQDRLADSNILEEEIEREKTKLNKHIRTGIFDIISYPAASEEINSRPEKKRTLEQIQIFGKMCTNAITFGIYHTSGQYVDSSTRRESHGKASYIIIHTSTSVGGARGVPKIY